MKKRALAAWRAKANTSTLVSGLETKPVEHTIFVMDNDEWYWDLPGLHATNNGLKAGNNKGDRIKAGELETAQNLGLNFYY